LSRENMLDMADFRKVVLKTGELVTNTPRDE